MLEERFYYFACPFSDFKFVVAWMQHSSFSKAWEFNKASHWPILWTDFVRSVQRVNSSDLIKLQQLNVQSLCN